MVNEMVDVIESGLSENREADPRALFISLTLTSTSTLPIVTTTVTRNTAAFCWSSSGSLSACTTTTAATTTTTAGTTTTTTATTTTTVASTGRKKRSPYHIMNMKEQFEHTVQDFVDARVFLDGKEVSIDMILPTSSHASERSDLEDMLAEQTMYTNKDAPGLMSGRMEWSEVGIESGNLHKPCGRSDKVTPEKRPRIIALQNEEVSREKRNKNSNDSKNKQRRKKSQPEPKARGSLSGIATLRRSGDVTISDEEDHKIISSEFAVGPLQLEVSKSFGEAKQRKMKSAKASTDVMKGVMVLKVKPDGSAHVKKVVFKKPDHVDVSGSIADKERKSDAKLRNSFNRSRTFRKFTFRGVDL